MARRSPLLATTYAVLCIVAPLLAAGGFASQQVASLSSLRTKIRNQSSVIPRPRRSVSAADLFRKKLRACG